MAEVVLDANVIVGFLDANDSLHARSSELLRRLEERGDAPVLLDICVSEAVSVLCRRARERRGSSGGQALAKAPPDLRIVIERVRQWAADGEIVWIARHSEDLVPAMLEVIEATRGRLNWNDALLAVLQSKGLIDEIASFDEGFDVVPGVRRIS